MADWMNRTIAKAKAGDAEATLMTDYVYDQMVYLQKLTAEPFDETATLRRVVQSRSIRFGGCRIHLIRG